MSHPDEYGERRRSPAPPQNIETFPSVVRRQPDMNRLATDMAQPLAETAEAVAVPQNPDDRAKLMLDQIADDFLWIPYGTMMEFARGVLANDGSAPKTPNEIADVIYQWAKARRAEKK